MISVKQAFLYQSPNNSGFAPLKYVILAHLFNLASGVRIVWSQMLSSPHYAVGPSTYRSALLVPSQFVLFHFYLFLLLRPSLSHAELYVSSIVLW